ncbi:MAG: PD-(D/E)XK nuclease family protein, partial [Lentisphaeria bacterium]|nr:PD-(D/E)XK nuclease family protein [Lentisphaeria bacterium]
MGWQDVKIESVLERDTDLLILEEWNVNIEFAHWLLEQLSITQKFSSFDGWHSVTDPQYGETDLLLVAENASTKIAVLLENKIDAIAQAEQSKRYFLRAEKLKQELGLTDAFVGIIAPENYLRNNQEAQNYPFRISYESAAEWFSSKAGVRDLYRAAVLRSAIEKERRGYRPIKDEQVSRFWHDYWKCLQRDIPEVRMKEPDIVPSASDWPELYFSWFPAKWKLVHKLSRGVLDLETKLSPAEAELLQKSLAETEFSIAQTGKSFSIRLNVVPLDRN